MIERELNYGRHVIERFLAHSGSYRVVVDLGAGWGHDLALAAAREPGACLHAVELLDEQSQRLRARGIDVHTLDIERDRLPFANGEVDLVIANQILEHTKQIFWISHEVSRVLAVGGNFIIGVPNLGSLHNRLMLMAGRQPTCIQSWSAHVRGFTRDDLWRFVSRCFPDGYALAEWGGSNFYPLPPSLARPAAAILPSMAVSTFVRLEKRREYHREFLDFPLEQRLETNYFLG